MAASMSSANMLETKEQSDNSIRLDLLRKARSVDGYAEVAEHLDRAAQEEKQTEKTWYIPLLSQFHHHWVVLRIIGIIVLVWAAPFMFGLYKDSQHFSLWGVWLLDIFFAIDLYLRLRRIAVVVISVNEFTLYTKPTDITSYRFRRLGTRFHYFCIFLATFPFDVLAIPFSWHAVYAVRLLKLLHLLSLENAFKHLIKERSSLRVDPLWLKLLRQAVIIIFGAHCAGCFFYRLGQWEVQNGADSMWFTTKSPGGIDVRWTMYDNATDTFTNSFNSGCPATTAQQSCTAKVEGAFGVRYLKSLYWAIVTLTSVGYGDFYPITENEMAFAIAVELFGWFSVGRLIGLLTPLITSSLSTHIKHVGKADQIQQFMDTEVVPIKQRRKMREFSSMLYSRSFGTTEDHIYQSLLPTVYRREIGMFLIGSALHRMTMFKEVPAGFLEHLAGQCRFLFFLPGDVVVRRGERTSSCYILLRGEARVMDTQSLDLRKDNKKTETIATDTPVFARAKTAEMDVENLLGPGDFFCHESFFFPEVQTQYTVVASQATDVCYFTKEQLETLIAALSHRHDPLVEKMHNAMREQAEYLSGTALVDRSASGGMNKNPAGSRYVIEPNSLFRSFWSVLALIGVVYYAMIIPFRITFWVQDELDSQDWLWLGLDWVVDAFFAVDIYLRLVHFAIENPVDANNPITSRPIFMTHYARGDMWLDIAAAVPLELIELVSNRNLAVMLVLRANRLLRVRHIGAYARTVNRAAERGVSSFGGSIVLSSSFFSIFRYVAVAAILFHWVGCLFYFISDMQTTFEDLSDTWIQAEGLVIRNPDDTETLLKSRMPRYVRSFHWAWVTGTMVGYGKVVPVTIWEILYAVLFIFFGTYLYIYILALVMTMVDTVNAPSAAQDRNMNVMDQYIKRINTISDEHTQTENDIIRQAHAERMVRVEARIRSLQRFVWTRQKGHEGDVLDTFPAHIRNEVIYSMVLRPVCESLTVLAPYKVFLLMLASRVNSRVYATYDWIASRGTPASEAYWLNTGAVQQTQTYPSHWKEALFDIKPSRERAATGHAKAMPKHSPVNSGAHLGRIQLADSDDDTDDSGTPDVVVEELDLNATRARADTLGTDEAKDRKSFSSKHFFGRSALLAEDGLYECSFRATQPCSVYVIKREDFFSLLSDYPSMETKYRNWLQHQAASIKLKQNTAANSRRLQAPSTGPSDSAIVSHSGNGNGNDRVNTVEMTELKSMENSDDDDQDEESVHGIDDDALAPEWDRIRTDSLHRISTDAASILKYSMELRGMKENHPFRLSWKALKVLHMVWFLVIVPVRIAFFTTPYSATLDFFTALFFLIDFFFDMTMLVEMFYLRRFKFIETVQGRLVPPRESFKHYLRTDFLLDLMGTLVIDNFLLLMNDKSQGARILFWVRLLRLLHLRWFNSYFDHFAKQIAARGQRTKNSCWSPALLNLAKQTTMVIILAHFFACLWWFVGLNQNKDTSWINQSAAPVFAGGTVGVVDQKVDELVQRYIQALYFSIVSMATVGYGDIKPLNTVETLCTLFLIIIGVVLYGGITGNISSLLAASDRDKNDYNQDVDATKKAVEVALQQPVLAERVERYFESLWADTRGVEEEEIKDKLSPQLREDIYFHLYKPILRRTVVFANHTVLFIRKLASVCEYREYEEYEELVTAGDTSDSMFVLLNGRVHKTNFDEVIEEYVFPHPTVDTAPFPTFGVHNMLCSAPPEQKYDYVAVEQDTTCLVVHHGDFVRVVESLPSGRLRNEALSGVLRAWAVSSKTIKDFDKSKTQFANKTSVRRSLGGTFGSQFRWPKKGCNRLWSRDDKFRQWWDLFVLLAITAHLIAVPALGVFTGADNVEKYFVVLILCWIVDTFFVVDLGLRMRRFVPFDYMDKVAKYTGNLVIRDASGVSAHYFKGRPGKVVALILDWLSVFPLDVVVLLYKWNWQGQSLGEISETLGLYRANHALIAYRFAGTLRAIDYYAVENTFIAFRYIARRAGKLVFVIGLCLHWAACGWYLLGTYDYADSSLPTWVDANSVTDRSPFGRYVVSVYWSVTTVTTVGYGDITPQNIYEIFYAILVIFLGTVLYADIIGSISVREGNLYEPLTSFYNKMKILRRYLEYRHIPISLRNRIMLWHDRMRASGHYADEEQLLDKLPMHFYLELSENINSGLLSCLPFFNKSEFINSAFIAGLLSRRRYLKGDVVYSQGSAPHYLFYVVDGSVDMYPQLPDDAWARVRAITEEVAAAAVKYRDRAHTAAQRETLQDWEEHFYLVSQEESAAFSGSNKVIKTVLASGAEPKSHDAGSLLGGVAFFLGDDHMETAVVSADCEMLVLSSVDFALLLKLFPKQKDALYREFVDYARDNGVRVTDESREDMVEHWERAGQNDCSTSIKRRAERGSPFCKHFLRAIYGLKHGYNVAEDDEESFVDIDDDDDDDDAGIDADDQKDEFPDDAGDESSPAQSPSPATKRRRRKAKARKAHERASTDASSIALQWSAGGNKKKKKKKKGRRTNSSKRNPPSRDSSSSRLMGAPWK